MQRFICTQWSIPMALFATAVYISFRWQSLTQIYEIRRDIVQLSHQVAGMSNLATYNWSGLLHSFHDKNFVCEEIPWSDLDSSIPQKHLASVVKGSRYYFNKNVELDRVALPGPCVHKLIDSKKWQSYSSVDKTVGHGCFRVPGVWAILQGRTRDNAVKALLAYYPIFLIAKGLRVSDENMHVTAFTESHLPVHFVVHEALGTLMHWKVLQAQYSQDVHRQNTCYEFEFVITAEAYQPQYMPSMPYSKTFALYIDQVAKRINSTVPYRCQQTILVAAGTETENTQDVMRTITKAAPMHTVTETNLQELPLRERVGLVRRASVLVLLHGSYSENVVWLQQLAIAVEVWQNLLPDVLSWRVASLSGKIVFRAANQSDLHIVVKHAVNIAAQNVGDSFTPKFGEYFDAEWCDWCRGEIYTC